MLTPPYLRWLVEWGAAIGVSQATCDFPKVSKHLPAFCQVYQTPACLVLLGFAKHLPAFWAGLPSTSLPASQVYQTHACLDCLSVPSTCLLVVRFAKPLTALCCQVYPAHACFLLGFAKHQLGFSHDHPAPACILLGFRQAPTWGLPKFSKHLMYFLCSTMANFIVNLIRVLTGQSIP